MGYYTWYEIDEITGENVEALQHDFEAGVITTEYGALNEMFESVPGPVMDSMKWYSFKEDMQRISTEYPNTLIILSGNGEEPGDMWRAHFRNGDYEIAQAQILFASPSDELIHNEPAIGIIKKDEEDLPDEDF